MSDAIASANYSRPHYPRAPLDALLRRSAARWPGTIRHLWHGPIRGRGCRVRQAAAAGVGFDPEAPDRPAGEALAGRMRAGRTGGGWEYFAA